METHPDPRRLDPEPIGDWALALDCEEEDEIEDDAASGSFGSLTSLRIGKPKKVPVLVLDPEEAAAAFQQFEMSAALILDGGDERPAPAAPGFLGLGPIDETALDAESGEEEEFFEEFEVEALDEEDEYPVVAGNEILDEILGLHVGVEAPPADDAEADGETDGERIAAVSDRMIERGNPLDLGQHDHGEFAPDPLPIADEELWASPDGSGPADDLPSTLPPFDQIYDAWSVAPRDAGDAPETNEPGDNPASGWPGSERPEPDWPELADPDDRAPVASEVLARIAGPVAQSSVRARLVRDQHSRKTIWQHICAALVRLYRYLTQQPR